MLNECLEETNNRCRPSEQANVHTLSNFFFFLFGCSFNFPLFPAQVLLGLILLLRHCTKSHRFVRLTFYR